MKKYSTLRFWLPKIPFLSLIGIFLLPLIITEIHYQTGLFFIALYISYWSLKVFEGYYYVLKSYLKLLKMEKRDFKENTLILSAAKELEHIIILPIYTEPYDVIEESVLSIANNNYPYLDKVTILLATEERAPHANSHAEKIIEHHGSKIQIVNILHPRELPDEGKVK